MGHCCTGLCYKWCPLWHDQRGQYSHYELHRVEDYPCCDLRRSGEYPGSNFGRRYYRPGREFYRCVHLLLFTGNHALYSARLYPYGKALWSLWYGGNKTGIIRVAGCGFRVAGFGLQVFQSISINSKKT